ncbi:DUF5753 domain-containing protein [Sphaerisporangium sp. NPDC051011]|uniref:DUF5753 domain-containing protein n=1 Tax=Sphaerisporangium sp. NPDC051011 TaxID=3155792 RepID=UPI0033E894F3
MPSSPSSSVQQAREALAGRLREIRLDAGLSARALAAAAGWHESKTSRIENAKTPPSDADIKVWCAVCEAADQVGDLIASSRAVASMYVEWRRVQRTGLERLQKSSIPLYERTRRFRFYHSLLIPGLFQTAGYAGALMAAISTFREIPDDIEQAVAVRMERQKVLHSGARFAVLVEQSVLYYQVGDAEVMAGQLDHLISMAALPSVSLGVVPFATGGRPVWPLEGFSVFDDHQVNVELLSAMVTVTQPREIALYVKAFGRLADMAVYGAAARSLIAAAIDDLR